VTLYLTPVFYTYMDSLLKWRHGGKRVTNASGDEKSLVAPGTEQLAQH